jgi:SAM-dependent methyltransferase
MLYPTAQYYDELYAAAGKDYRTEAQIVHDFIRKYKRASGKRLLDVGCGTGKHMKLLGKTYEVEGLDVEPGMLKLARKANPGVRFHQGDMADFQLKGRFDVITCLFSAIGYMHSKARLRKAIRNMGEHLEPGGVLLVEPWFTPSEWYPGHISTLEVDKPDLKVVRMSYSGMKGSLSTIEFHYLIGRNGHIEHVVELHKLALFEEQDYLDAFMRAGLAVEHDPKGLDGRGLYIGIKHM